MKSKSKYMKYTNFKTNNYTLIFNEKLKEIWVWTKRLQQNNIINDTIYTNRKCNNIFATYIVIKFKKKINTKKRYWK